MIDDGGYDRHQWMKRARAFKHTIFPSCARRIILQKHYGYGFMADSTLVGMLKILKPFIKKLLDHAHIKAYNYVMDAFIDFLVLIEYERHYDAYMNIKLLEK